jgi:hypothetical protein
VRAFVLCHPVAEGKRKRDQESESKRGPNLPLLSLTHSYHNVFNAFMRAMPPWTNHSLKVTSINVGELRFEVLTHGLREAHSTHSTAPTHLFPEKGLVFLVILHMSSLLTLSYVQCEVNMLPFLLWFSQTGHRTVKIFICPGQSPNWSTFPHIKQKNGDCNILVQFHWASQYPQ